jgi:CBS domain-containing protein
MVAKFIAGDDALLEPGNPASAAFYAERTARAPSMQSPLSVMLDRKPVSCRPETPIRAALESMDRHRIGSMIVVDADGRPIGILTLLDVLSRVTLPACRLDDPISAVMTAGVTSLPTDATLYDAALTMIRNGIRHVIVVDDGRLAGVVTQKDLFNPQRTEVRHLSSEIKVAQDLASLKNFSIEIQSLAHSMLVQGVAVEQLTHFIASLNDLLTQRIIDLEFGAKDLRGIRWCWMALGSEGRFEQTFATDQDSAIVFSPPPGLDPDEARDLLLPIARRVNQALAACGFPLCRGNIMGGNPACCLTLDEWRRRFGQWLNAGDPEALLNGSIFFDLRTLHGDASLVVELKEWLLETTRANGRFLHQMAANALRNLPPLGHIRDFVLDGEGEEAHTLDIKVHGTTLFVDAARIFSLASGVTETNTLSRLRLAAPLVDVPSAEVESWVDSFLVLQRLRLKHQHLQYTKGLTMSNRIDPYRLHELDRLMLKESLRQAKKVQSRLAMDYRL